MVKGTSLADFKDQNLELFTLIPDFKELYDNMSEEEASKTLWSAYYTAVISNPSNPFKNTKSDEERRNLIISSYNPNYDEKYKYLEKIFNTICLSKDETLYNIHLRKYEEFTANISTMSLDTADALDKYAAIMTKFGNMVKVFNMLEEKYKESEKNKSVIEGGGELSRGDQRRQQN